VKNIAELKLTSNELDTLIHYINLGLTRIYKAKPEEEKDKPDEVFDYIEEFLNKLIQFRKDEFPNPYIDREGDDE
jgi:hypothetical protein